MKKNLLANSIIFIAIILRIANQSTAEISYYLLLALCIFGPREIILALFLSFFFSSLNPSLAPQSSSVILKYLILFASFVSSFYLLPLRVVIENKILYTSSFIFFIFIFFHSLFLSPFPDVSILRILSWSCMFILLINCWSRLDRVILEKLIKELFVLLTAVVFFSLLLVSSKSGYVKNSHGFQGVLNHPQTFGLVVGILGIMILNFYLIRSYSLYFYSIATILVIYLLVLSESRTAIFAFIGASFITFLTNFGGRIFYLRIHMFVRKLLIAIILLIIISYVIFEFTYIYEIDFIKNIITKSNRTLYGNFFNIYLDSRGDLINNSYNNIKNNFWFGLGFSMPSRLDGFLILRDQAFGIPTSAPIEKGMFYIAIFEEIGFFGTCLYFYFLFVCFLSFLKSDYKFFPYFIIVLLFNFGESTFFSISGIGGMLIIFFTLSIARKKNFSN